MSYNESRIRELNKEPIQLEKKYILYWMTSYRRLESNHSLDLALEYSKKYKKELIILEALRKDYKWNSKRIHQFILQGMVENKKQAEKLGLTYWCYVETDKYSKKGLLYKLAEEAVVVITDDFPCFIVPKQIENFANKVKRKVIAVDSNSIIPLSKYGETASAARVLRPRIHKLFSEAYTHRAKVKISKKDFYYTENKTIAPFQEFDLNIESTLSSIRFQNEVSPISYVTGGFKEANKILDEFIKKKLNQYADERSNPHSPSLTPSSGLSPYLHFGHISVETIVTKILDWSVEGEWSIEAIDLKNKGDKDIFFSPNLNINSYFDELLTWRDIGYLFFWKKKEFNKDLNSLPDWIKSNLKKHTNDKREYLYTLKEFESASTHDPLWNAAQNELVYTGKMHNYMRMLWGKKVIEWSSSYEEAFQILEELNNKYALDGRNPNSYTGILWCFGLFDRPWFPERNVHGVLRYMSSDSTKRKFKMQEYLNYTDKLVDKSSSLF
jgi:deoxyribodipyrimidine photo-lyase